MTEPIENFRTFTDRGDTQRKRIFRSQNHADLIAKKWSPSFTDSILVAKLTTEEDGAFQTANALSARSGRVQAPGMLLRFTRTANSSEDRLLRRNRKAVLKWKVERMESSFDIRSTLHSKTDNWSTINYQSSSFKVQGGGLPFFWLTLYSGWGFVVWSDCVEAQALLWSIPEWIVETEAVSKTPSEKRDWWTEYTTVN